MQMVDRATRSCRGRGTSCMPAGLAFFFFFGSADPRIFEDSNGSSADPDRSGFRWIRFTPNYDQGSNSEIDLTLSPAHQARFFEIDSEGVIWVAKGAQFDREDVDHFELIAVATDRGKPPLSSTVPVSITLLDVNDNKPRFYPQTYRHQLSKTTTTDSHITTVTATDSDDEAAGTVHYKITGGNDKKFFKINESSGSVSFSKPAKIGYYELTVQAYDGYGLTR